MELYLATMASFEPLLDRLDRPNVLTSYVEGWNPDRAQVGKVFLDSGAFTAHNTGKPIDLQMYTEFCQKTAGSWDVIAALDVIGNPEASSKNYEFMTDEGVDILPTYHIGTEKKWFYRLLDKYKYVAIGGVASRISSRTNSLAQMLPHFLWAHKAAQGAGVRLHGFGITYAAALNLFPWHSVDSSTFNVGSRFRSLVTFENGQAVQRICAAPSKTGLAQSRLLLAKYLQTTSIRYPYRVAELFPQPDTKEAAMNRCHFNAMTLQHAAQHATRRHNIQKRRTAK